MNDMMPLDGRSVLLVDDDFILVMNARRDLEEVGAKVIGPFNRADAALSSLEEGRPDVAVVDLNLGAGPNFDLVRALTAQRIPTLIVTGYDQCTIPPDLASVPCLQKPIVKHQLVSAVAQLLALV